MFLHALKFHISFLGILDLPNVKKIHLSPKKKTLLYFCLCMFVYIYTTDPTFSERSPQCPRVFIMQG